MFRFFDTSPQASARRLLIDAVLVSLVYVLMCSLAFGQAPMAGPTTVPPSIVETRSYAAVLPWRNQMADLLKKQQELMAQQKDTGTDPALLMLIMQRQQPPAASDPAHLQALNNIAAINQQILQAIQQRNAVPIQVPVPAGPSVVVVPQAVPAAPSFPMMQAAPGAIPLAGQQAPQFHFYNAPPGVQQFPSAPVAPVQPLPVAPLYQVQPLPVAPLAPVQPIPVAPVAPVQPLPAVPPVGVQPLPVAPIPKMPPAQPLPVAPLGSGPSMNPSGPAGGFQRFTVTRALGVPVR